MAEGLENDQMIEIGDPTEESSSSESAPQVVIQYHERGGVPWMLIPPLLVLSAVVAVLLYVKLAPRGENVRVPVAVKVADESKPGDEPVVAAGPVETPSQPPATPEKAIELPPSLPEANPAEPVAPPSVPAAEPVNNPELNPAPSPRVQGLGFDPKALELERKAEAPADPALAPAARDEQPFEIEKPREVDPDLLPPDPRQAKARQQQRRLEVMKKVEDERFRFHADLKAICRKFREDSGPEIDELRKQYDTRVDPAAEKLASKLLGKNGKFVGADRKTRIELLRSLGYPEPVILGDIVESYGKLKINERDGPRTFFEALYDSALFLLRNPPGQAAPASRPVSSTSNGTTTAPRSNPGLGVGSAR